MRNFRWFLNNVFSQMTFFLMIEKSMDLFDFFVFLGKDFFEKLLRDKHINTNLIRHDDHY